MGVAQGTKPEGTPHLIGHVSSDEREALDLDSQEGNDAENEEQETSDVLQSTPGKDAASAINVLLPWVRIMESVVGFWIVRVYVEAPGLWIGSKGVLWKVSWGRSTLRGAYLVRD